MEMYQMKRFIDVHVERSPLSMFLLLSNVLCSVRYIAGKDSIYHFCVMIKDLSILFQSDNYPRF